MHPELIMVMFCNFMFVLIYTPYTYTNVETTKHRVIKLSDSKDKEGTHMT